MLSPERINELHRLADDALVDTHEAAAFLKYKPASLIWFRTSAPHRSPKYVRVGSRSIRYRMGDLRAFVTREA